MLKADEVDMCVEETMQLIAGEKEAAAFCPGIDLQRLDGGEEEAPHMEEDEGRMDEYERLTYEVFDKFVR